MHAASDTLSQAARRRWQNPAYRASQLPRVRAMAQQTARDPVIRARRSETLRRLWATQRQRFDCLQPEQIAQIADMARAGLSTKEIARQWLVCRDTINWHLRRLGLSRPSRPTLTPEQIACIADMARDGLPARDIAEAVGITASAVSRRLRALGLSQSARPRLSPEQVRHLIVLGRQHLPVKDIARVLGISTQAVRNRLKKHGLSRPKPAKGRMQK